MPIQTINDLKPDPNNANRGTERGHRIVNNSIQRHGAGRSGLAARDGTMIAGSQTLEEMAALGMKIKPVHTTGDEWVVVIRDDVEPGSEQATLMGLEDNRGAQEGIEWDPGILAELAQQFDVSGLFTGDELAEWAQPSEPEAGAGGDEFDTTPDDGPTRAQLGDLWIIGGVHRLLVGDCTDPANVARLMGGERAALVVTSPPYNQKLDTFKPSGMQKENPAFVQRMADAYEDSMPEDEYQKQQIALLEMVKQFLTPNASVFYNHKIRYRDKRIVSPIEWLLRTSYAIRQEIIWDRGSSITLNARMFIPADERIYWLRVGEDFVFNDTPDIKAYSTVWEVAAINDVQASAAFATEIPTRCIRAASKPNDIVFEPYCGTGTTIIAAHREGRRGYGMERDPRWADTTLRRAEAEGLTVELVPSS